MSVKIGCTWTDSSEVSKQHAHNVKVVGSIPTRSTKEALPFSVFLLFLFVKQKPFREVVGCKVPLYLDCQFIIYLLLEGLPTLLLYIMSWSGKNRVIQKLRDEAGELRKWMSEHASPSTPASEFCDIANRYAIICTKIYVIEKQW